MHDLDRVLTEYGAPDEEFDSEAFEMALESEDSGADGAEMEEAEQLELAAELLDVNTEQELDQFIGKWINRARKKVGGLLKGGTGRVLGGMLKGVVRRALPGVAALGGHALVPGLGGVLGSKAATAASSLLGLELEGLSPEDQDFEAARQVVRLGNAAIANAVRAPDQEPPQQAAARAVRAAAERYAPGLVAGSGIRAAANGRRPATGRWYRRGSRIILEGL